MQVQLKDIKYIIDHKSDHTPLEVAVAYYALMQHKQLVKAQEERCRSYNFAVSIANSLRKLMFYINGGGQHQQESSDKIVYDDCIGNPPLQTPNEILNFVNDEFKNEIGEQTTK